MKKPSTNTLTTMLLRQFAKLSKVREDLLESAFSQKFSEDLAAHFSEVQVEGDVDYANIETLTRKCYSWNGTVFLIETVKLVTNYHQDASRRYTLSTEFRVPKVEQPNQSDSI